MKPKMMTTMELLEGEFNVVATRLDISPMGKLQEIRVSVYGYDPEDNSQYLETSFSLNKDHYVSGPEYIPAVFIPAAINLFRNISAILDKDFDESFQEPVKEATHHLSPKWKGANNG